MRKIIYYAVLMIIIIILLPLLIVKGCSRPAEKIPAPSEKPEELKINVYISSEDRVEEMLLEEYIRGVVAGEMPAEFELEALKAQAVAARTYAYGRMTGKYVPKDNPHQDADICTDPTHCQAWMSRQAGMEKWGIFNTAKYWGRIEKAVAETENTIIVYENQVINPVFHSNSGGKTENAEEVWIGNGVPYLKSVFSSGEEECPGYKHTVTIKTDDFISAFKKEVPGIQFKEKDIIKDIEVLDYTEGNRVKNIRVGDAKLKGTEVRRILSLKSANFTIEKGGSDTLKITVCGSGHGVGMSQWGANYLARKGAAFGEIIRYYYQGVELTTIDEYQP